MIYKWKSGAHLWGSAQIVGEHIEQLTERSGGSVTADIVLDDATSPDSPLHQYFEWDDSAAAKEFRLDQARGILQAVVIVRDELHGEPTRAFVHVSIDSESTYRPIGSIMGNAELREVVLKAALQELREFKKRYAQLKELAAVFGAIDALKEAV